MVGEKEKNIRELPISSYFSECISFKPFNKFHIKRNACNCKMIIVVVLYVPIVKYHVEVFT